jgi:flavin reductase (DIM6/NTAB) family NADH-FMN oxidoreductase RutF
MTVDPRQLRNCLGHFATGITVVTCTHDGQPHGATVNAFAAVSLDPPLVMVSVPNDAKAREFLGGSAFTVNVLRERQELLALHFAGHPMPTPVRWAPRNGMLAPRLLDVLAYLACTPWQHHDAGDHTIFLGKVEEYAYFFGAPLLFYQGRFGHLGPQTDSEPWIGSLDNPEVSWLLPVP